MKCPYCIKVCSKCGKILVANTMNFRKKKDGKYGLRAECTICKKQLDLEYRKKNIDRIREHDRKRYPQRREERLEYSKQYQKENKDKIKEQRHQYYENNKDVIKERNKKYRQENPEKFINWNTNRRLKEENQGNGITREQWLDMMNFFDWKCAYSDEYIGSNSEYRTIDHIVPLDKNGEHEIWNCVPMYSKYNYSKKNKDMIEWYTKQEFYSEERLNRIYQWIEYAKNKYKNN